MRKILGTIFIFSFASLMVSFLIILNLKISLWSPDKVKDFADKSNIYEFVSASIRDSLVKASDTSVDQGGIMEVITGAISPQTTKEVAESIIDQWFLIVGDPKANTFIEIPLSKYGDRAADLLGDNFVNEETLSVLGQEFGQNLSLSRNILIDLDNNQTIVWFSRINTVLMGYAAVLAVGALLILLVPGSNFGGRLSWLGSAFILVFAYLLVISIGLYFTSQLLLDENIAKLGISDPKTLVGLSKFLSLVLNRQLQLLAVECGISFLFGLVFFTVGRSMKEHKLDLNDSI